MTRKFDYFVLFAEMRTGSNFLETSICEFPGITSYGEAFNPVFIGKQGKTELLGISLEARRDDPLALLQRMRDASPGLFGFRFFHDHDPRVLDHVLSDPRCAKIILTRNPLESYVSRKIASATGQWKLQNVRFQRSARVEFKSDEFLQMMEELQNFQLLLLHGLQVSGQTAFYIAYEDIQNVRVLNGLGKYLGLDAKLDAPSDKLKKQNPEDIRDKVTNPEEMERALARLDRFNLSRTPNFEPRRGAGVPSFSAGAQTPLLFMPVRCGPEARVLAWMEDMDGAPPVDGFTGRSIRRWQSANPGHRTFTVVRHPLARAHAAFCDYLLTPRLRAIKTALIKVHKLPLPQNGEVLSVAEHREAFLAFLRFVKGNLSGQTSVHVHGSWASQCAVLQGFAQFALPDFVLREEEIEAELPRIAALLGKTAPAPRKTTEERPVALADIHDEELEAAAREAYDRDYLAFGYGNWQG
ncbi:nodulation protein NodH [Halodurantibacterium flavum]|uniref:Nodulation protein NodH n=1 Tax=Halodurantibacterium flavum TaxID=1382802 RepID=A0ABW4S7K6_9RHOB